MWAVQPRFERDLRAFVESAAALGYSALEINHSMDTAQVAALRSQGTLPATAVHAPAPLERHSRRGWNRDLNLASTDEEERDLAVRYTRRSIELAAEVGARFVVVHLGHVGDGELPGERRRRELFGRGETAGDAWRHAGVEAVKMRAALAPRYLEQARRSLAELAQAAGAAGVALALEARARYHQIPLPEEAAELLAGYAPAVAGYWHDVGHTEVLHRLGMVELDSWFELLADRVAGVHLHDVRGLTDHRAPGNGDVDFARLAARLPPRRGAHLRDRSARARRRPRARPRAAARGRSGVIAVSGEVTALTCRGACCGTLRLRAGCPVSGRGLGVCRRRNSRLNRPGFSGDSVH